MKSLVSFICIKSFFFFCSFIFTLFAFKFSYFSRFCMPLLWLERTEILLAFIHARKCNVLEKIQKANFLELFDEYFCKPCLPKFILSALRNIENFFRFFHENVPSIHFIYISRLRYDLVIKVHSMCFNII